MTCLSTRIPSESDPKTAQVINGDDFVTIHNASGSTKFEMKLVPSLMKRFMPNFTIVPFDRHEIPISSKRIKKAVVRTIKYEKVFAEACNALSIPFISPVIGADCVGERDRSVEEVNESSSGFAFCNLASFDCDKKLQLLQSSKVPVDAFRMVRGSISPAEIVELISLTDAFDSTFADDITAKGHALQLEFPEDRSPDAAELSAIADKDNLNLWDESFFDDFAPIDEKCSCHCCKNYKRAYVHHLLKTHEMLAGVLLMMHNLHQYNKWIHYLRSL